MAITKNFSCSELSATICFGDYGLLLRFKMLWFLILGRTVKFSGNAVRSTQSKDLKEIP